MTAPKKMRMRRGGFSFQKLNKEMFVFACCMWLLFLGWKIVNPVSWSETHPYYLAEAVIWVGPFWLLFEFLRPDTIAKNSVKPDEQGKDDKIP